MTFALRVLLRLLIARFSSIFLQRIRQSTTTFRWISSRVSFAAIFRAPLSECCEMGPSTAAETSARTLRTEPELSGRNSGVRGSTNRALMQMRGRIAKPASITPIVAILCYAFCCDNLLAQEAAYFALQRPGQGNVAVDKKKRVAYITDLGKSGDGDRVIVDGTPLLDTLVAEEVETLVFTCSHPHSDHSGGIRALFENPQVFFNDADRKVPRFRSIVVIENQMKDSLFSILNEGLGPNSAIKISRVDAINKNAFVGLSDPKDDVYIESIPYEPLERAGTHGRSIVTHFVLGQKYSNVDFDDASSDVILKTVKALNDKGIKSIDSFVVPHHGSAYHDIEPILQLSPKTAIITVNPRNPYGHPAPSILLSLIDRLGAQNVFFTGSVDHVILGPDGVKHARYTANQAESFNLFVRPSYEREKAKSNPTAVALYRQLESRMTGVSSATQSETKRDEITVRLEAAEGSNEDLLSIADKLALGTTVSPRDKKQFEDSVRSQAQRLDALQKMIEKYEHSEKTELADEHSRIERLFLQIGREPGSTIEVTVPPLDSDDGSRPTNNVPIPTRDADESSLNALSQAVSLGIQDLLSSVPEPSSATRNVREARYFAPTDSIRMGEPEVSRWLSGEVKIPHQKTASYSEMESPNSIEDIPGGAEDRPGGIAIGNTAIADDGALLEKYVLTFDVKRETLVLNGPNHSEMLFDHKVDSAKLKALYRFAASNRSAAVSVEVGEKTDTVRLDPSFVDTKVGRDLVAADLVAGDLDFNGFIYLGHDPFMKSFNEAMKDFRSCTGLARTAATWFDNPTVIHTDGAHFSLTGTMRLEFVAEATRPNQWNCNGMRCKDLRSTDGTPSGTKLCHLTTGEKFVQENYGSFSERFPSVEDMNEDARIIGFLRWARRPGHLAGINLFTLANVPASDSRQRTPDLLMGR